MTTTTRTTVRSLKGILEQRHTELDRLEFVLPRLCRAFGDDSYLGQLTAEGKRAETMAIYLGETYLWADWLRRNRPGVTATDATAGHLADYRDELAATGLSPNTLRLMLSSLRVFYDFVDKQREPDEQHNPARELPLPTRVNLPIGRYDRQQALAIVSAAADAARTAHENGDQAEHLLARRDHAMLSCLYYSGVRRGELRRLHINHVDFRHRQLRVSGKGGRTRTVPVPAVLLKILRAYLDDVRLEAGAGEFLFLELHTADGELQWRTAGPDSDPTRLRTPTLQARIETEDNDYGLGPYTLYQRAHVYGRLAGVDGPHGRHRWRHTHAAICAEAGMSLESIAERLGHDLGGRESILGYQPTTLTYISVDDAYVRAVVEQALPHPLRPTATAAAGTAAWP